MSLKNQFSKILVPIDGSKNADKALSKALIIAEKFDSKIILIHVITDFLQEFSTTAEGLAIPDTAVVKIRTAIEEQAETMIMKRLEQVQKKNLNCEYIIKVGDTGSEIIQYAEKNNIELIVIGARGLGKFKQLLLGSVSNKVVTNSHCPILIIK
ncbi:MAG: universal stress protein [Nitrosopumilus sp.]|jgi:nucleotide-binding universal stress UspA family protein|nr:universal stress protein [Nitrosopumilus sp.]